jgi:4-hydroxy-tetrahydrodipicolinate synthase
VKQSGSEFAYHGPLVELGRKKNFVVLTGADTRLPEATAMGVSGCVSGLSNAVPDLVAASFADARRGAPAQTQSASARMAEVGRRISKVSFPLDVAAAMEARGLAVGSPKSIVSASTKARYANVVVELKDLFREWKLI